MAPKSLSSYLDFNLFRRARGLLRHLLLLSLRRRRLTLRGSSILGHRPMDLSSIASVAHSAGAKGASPIRTALARVAVALEYRVRGAHERIASS